MISQRNIDASLLPILLGFVLLMPTLAHAAGGDKKPKGDFLPVTGLAATVRRSDGGHGVMTVEAGIDTPDPVLLGYAEEVLPRLRDAYARVLQAYAGNLQAGTPPDADYLARQLQTATNQVLGKPGGRLLLGGVMLN